jgi:predicted RNase H-like HicB family nuclease
MMRGELPMKLRIEYRYDDESDNWNFRVPALGINGSADTRAEAAEEALRAIDFMLEAEGERMARPGAEVVYIALTPAVGRDEAPTTAP